MIDKIKELSGILGGRKLTFGIFIVLLGSAIEIWYPLHLSSILQNLFIMIYGAFSGSNVAATFANIKKGDSK